MSKFLNKKYYLFFIILVISIIAIIMLLLNYTYSYEDNGSNPQSTLEKAFYETIDAYQNRGNNIQYNTYKSTRYFSPEDATSQKMGYIVCSGDTREYYYDLFGIKIPTWTETLVNYTRANVGRPEVIAYGYKDKKFEDANGDGKDDVLGITQETLEANRGEFGSKIGDLLMWFDGIEKEEIKNPTLNGDIIPRLKVGDILSYKGHTFAISGLVYENGKIVDAKIATGVGGVGRYVNTKINASNHNFLIHRQNTKRYSLLSETSPWNKLLSSNNRVTEYSILRFVDENNGEYRLNYLGKTFGSDNKDYTNATITLSDKALDRIKYSGLYIEKTVDVFNNSVVQGGDKLTYTIKIKNNSNSNYDNNITVTENISEFVTYKSSTTTPTKVGKDGNNKVTNLNWNIGKLNAGNEVEIKYTVQVNNNTVGNIIESTGKVENIPSSLVKNKIGSNLTNDQIAIINNQYAQLKNNHSGRELINEIYKKGFGLELNINSFKINGTYVGTVKNGELKDGNIQIVKNGKLIAKYENDYILYDKSGYVFKNDGLINTHAKTVPLLNDKYSFSKIVLDGYYGALYYNSKAEGKEYNLKSFSSGNRVDTIYSGNFKPGDILIYINKDDPSTNENGEYVYIYTNEAGFVGVNLGKDGISGTADDRNVFSYAYYTNKDIVANSYDVVDTSYDVDDYDDDVYEDYYDADDYDVDDKDVVANAVETSYGVDDNKLKLWVKHPQTKDSNAISNIPSLTDEEANYQTLLGKDYFVILRPSLVMNNGPVTINYYQGDGTSSGGNTLLGSSTCNYGSSCTLKTYESLGGVFPLSKNKWTFSGWSSSHNGTEINYTDGQKFTYNLISDLNLYAVGSRNFTFSSGVAPTKNSGNIIQYWNSYNANVDYTTSINVPKAAAIDGWDFIGYRANNVASSTVTITGSDTLYHPAPTSLTEFDFRAIYKRNVSLLFDANGGTGTTTSVTDIQYYNSGYGKNDANTGSNISQVSFDLPDSKFTKTGYTFKGWSESKNDSNVIASGKKYTSFNPNVTDKNVTKTLYAIWQKTELADILRSNGFDVTNNFVSKFKLGETVASIKNKLGNDIIIDTDKSIISTGAIIKKGNESYDVVVKGDLTGDGKVNSGDLLQMRKYLLEEINLVGAYKQAGIIESSNEIKSLDLLRLRQYLLEQYVFK